MPVCTVLDLSHGNKTRVDDDRQEFRVEDVRKISCMRKMLGRHGFKAFNSFAVNKFFFFGGEPQKY